ncbi:SdrD B-like domain-containing protein [Longimicrobium terrae]|uniref:Putative repeat protein (TIGR01451 family) n=1 Tax=Longimicrobium terrae TaxID=1639882 RepID=A0A841H3U2_9BACT|nr:SdrD B-like domain-containing protein [Longimicrobium terrae]MBB4638310.1 putative repeat protein (TIGR01451 family) [Longimicrobium terrae]MBB6072622.1 putative repeat protein (TIGR01451 family) [Longimicrobium terrae]NNC28599.1 DUF11 domain-containing protein [Longimicrobium terrae]
MRFLSRSGMDGTSRRRTSVRRGLALALVLALAPAARAAAQVPVTQPVVNRATATYQGDGDTVRARLDAEATVTVTRTAGVAITPPRAAVMAPGSRRVLAHVLQNLGNGADRFTLSVRAPAGWTALLLQDLNGNGALDEGEPAIAAPLAAEAGAAVPVLLVIDAPADAADGEMTVQVQAVSMAAAEAQSSVTDRLTVRTPAASLALDKRVDRASAARGDTLVYTISYENAGDAVAPAVLLSDTLPAGARLVPGSVRWNGAALSDAEDGDAGTADRVDGGRDRLRVALGAVEPAAKGTIAFRAVVAADADPTVLANVASLSSGTTTVVSTPAVTDLGRPALQLSKTKISADSVAYGQSVAWAIRVSNSSDRYAARGVVITDTLPEGLVPVSGGPDAVITGQVVRWTLGELAAGAAREVEVTARVNESGRGAPLVNRAWAGAENADGVSASSLPIIVEQPTGGELEISKTSSALEASLGEAIPYTITLRNRGLAPLRNIMVTDELPEGARLVREGVAGADSIQMEGRMVRFFVAGPLWPTPEITIRYSLVMATAPRGGTRVGNHAWAQADNGRISSDTATAWVRLRQGQPMESRTLIGKVWIDRDGDGRQGAGDQGVEGVEVWSASGEVVTTDAQGRFSFPDLRRGGHVLRLDTLSLPRGARLAPGSAMDVRVQVDGWTMPTAGFRLVPGTEPVVAAAGGGGAAAPSTSPEPVPATVAPLWSEAARGDQERQSMVAGPGIRITAPMDGAIVVTNRMNVRLQGEPGAAARLYAGERMVGEGVLRPDGSMDFVGLEMDAGPGRLRAWTRNSWGQERWDSVAVHRSGAPHSLEAVGGPVQLRAEDRRPTPVRVRVLDEWGVPVADGPQVTAEAVGAMLGGEDADGSSQGWQGRAGVDGVVALPLRAGSLIGAGELRIRSAKATLTLPLTVLPTTRPLIATGAVQVGVGAAPESYGAMVVRGALDAQTAVSVTYDSRRQDGDTEFFGRGYDPSEDGRYPTLGDESDRRTFGSSTQALSARVERGLNWVEMGDVATGDFSGSERLGGYGRSLTGAAARVGTGAVVWRAFGSLTDQALSQAQLEADGTSGPYRFGGRVRPGTDRIAVEVRDRDNAARLLRRDELLRFYDYQIDYRTGEVMLSRAVPSRDAYGNPVYVVALLERRSGGESRFVGGLRMETDAARLMPRLGADSLGVAFFGVHDGTGTAGEGLQALGASPSDLFGAEVRMRRGGLLFGGEILSARGDSSSVAGQAHLRWEIPGDHMAVSAEWLRVGDGFASSMNPRLRSGLEELRLGAELRITDDARLRLRHERQNFREYDVQRQSTTLTAEQKVAGRRVTAEAGMLSDAQGAAGTSSVALGRATLALTPTTDVWLEGSRPLENPESGATRPEQIGVGASQLIVPGVRMEGNWRRARMAPDSAAYAIAGLTLKTDIGFGARAMAGVERMEAGEARHAAVLGWNQSLALGGGWTVNGIMERRFGLDRAPLVDPVRSLPFAHQEQERWAGSLGLDLLPTVGPRMSSRAEFHDGDQRSGWRFDLGGDMALGRNGALLTRHDWYEDNRKDAAAGEEMTRSERSMLGVAVRPAGSDAWNVLTKLEWRFAENPLAGTVLAGARTEQRMIAATDAVWAPLEGWTVAGRYALRLTTARDTVETTGTLRSTAQFVGGRLERDLLGNLRGRMDGRLLAEGITGARRWSLAPSLTMGFKGGLEIEGGYRFGTLEDADFANYGKRGLFAVLGLRFTEGSLATAADFWRERIRKDF